jgi:hypothetical protein
MVHSWGAFTRATRAGKRLADRQFARPATDFTGISPGWYFASLVFRQPGISPAWYFARLVFRQAGNFARPAALPWMPFAHAPTQPHFAALDRRHVL